MQPSGTCRIANGVACDKTKNKHKVVPLVRGCAAHAILMHVYVLMRCSGSTQSATTPTTHGRTNTAGDCSLHHLIIRIDLDMTRHGSSTTAATTLLLGVRVNAL